MGNIVYVCCLYYRRRYLEGIFLPLTDKVKDGLCLKYLLCRGEGLEPHRSRSTLVTLLQAIITKGCAAATASLFICKQSKDNLLLNSCEINFY